MNDSFATMRAKWTYMFASLDKNKDGLLTKDELYSLANDFIENYKLTGQKAIRIKFAAMTISDMIMERFGDRSKSLNLTEWINSMCSYLLKKPEHFIDGFETFYSTVFDVLDVDGNGEISVDEFEFYYKRFGRDVSRVSKAFGAIDVNKDGKISRDEFVKAYMNYLTDPDYSVDHLPLFY